MNYTTLYILINRLQRQIESSSSGDIEIQKELTDLKNNKFNISGHIANKKLVTDDNGDITTASLLPRIDNNGVLCFDVLSKD